MISHSITDIKNTGIQTDTIFRYKKGYSTEISQVKTDIIQILSTIYRYPENQAKRVNQTHEQTHR